MSFELSIKQVEKMESETDSLEPCQIDFKSVLEDEERQSIPVYLRIKPLDDEATSIKVIDSTTVETTHAFRANKRATYSRVFVGSSTQQEVFDGTTDRLIGNFLAGANVMTFAYGVTSSGKTFTIMGSHLKPGIIPRTLEKIFGSFKSKIEHSIPTYKPILFDATQQLSPAELDDLETCKASLISKVKGATSDFVKYSFESSTLEVSSSSGKQNSCASVCPFFATKFCCVWISIYEILNEVITDLLLAETKTKRRGLMVGQDTKGRMFVKNLTQFPVSNAAEAYSLLQYAKQNLAKASTKLNECSSRSHLVFTIKLVHWDTTEADTQPFVNQFVISDLAGSERQAKTGTSGVTLRQAGAINNSLLVLGRCLEALRKKDKVISAPFRDSKLTRILNPFFTLGGYVSLIICINPHVQLQDETMDTIRFSAIASEILQETTIRPLERLRQLRRLTRHSIVDPLAADAAAAAGAAADDDEAGIEHWEEAIHGRRVHDGTIYYEVRASYFNDMARDILRAEKYLATNEAAIDDLKQQLKEAEASKENMRFMHQDKMKCQWEKYRRQKEELDEMHKETLRTLAEELEEDIRIHKEKYLKYRNGYSKIVDYMTNKLWPELNLFRERFGYLEEYPPKEGVVDDVHNAENTLRYWQDKLSQKEQQFNALKKDLSINAEQIASLSDELLEHKKMLHMAELETSEARKESIKLCSHVRKLTDELTEIRNQFSDYDTLADQVIELKDSLREAEDSRNTLVAEYQIHVSSLTEELRELKSELAYRSLETGQTFDGELFEQEKMEMEVEKNVRIGDQQPALDKVVETLKSSKDAITISNKENEIKQQNGKKLATIEVLETQLEKFSQENSEFSDEIKTLRKQNEQLENEAKRSRELADEVQILTKKLANQQRRPQRECQTEKPSRRRRSVSTSAVELKTPVAANARRHLLCRNNEPSGFDEVLKVSIRDPSPVGTPFRKRFPKNK